ncbi:MAG: hypothetical protein Q4F76_09820 [Lachnospiraceae bacterium]|nr:hypothetical protein [Lachnospiraceae bacterium]
MKRLKRVKWFKDVFTAAAILSLTASFQSYAVVRINQVKVKFILENFDFSGLPQIEATVKDSAHYQVAFCERAEVYYEQENDDPFEDHPDLAGVYVVELTTDDGYQFRFYSSDQEKIHLSGMGAVLIKAKQEDNGHTLRLDVRLEDFDAYAGQIPYADWSGCRGKWSESQYAIGYRLRLSDPKGKYYYAETAGTTYDFAPLMLAAGTYRYDVRAISKNDVAGQWTSGGACTITEEIAAENRAAYQVESINCIIDSSKAHTPDNNRVEYLNTGWQETPEGEYWYRNCDGTYPQNIWKQIDGSWYYFGENGYMAHDTYITWKREDFYMSSDGHMLTDDYAPDGRRAVQTGTLMKEDAK